MSDVEDLLRDISDDVPEYVSSAVVDIETGMGVGSYNTDPDFDASVANATYAEFVKANREALDMLDADPYDTDDILVTTNGMYLLIRELSEEYYLGMAMTQDGNLALARRTVESYEDDLLSILPNTSA